MKIDHFRITVLLLSLLLVHSINAEEADVRLPGSHLKLDEAIAQSKLVIVGKIIATNDPNIGAGHETYSLKITPTEVLKGSVAGQVVAQVNVVTFTYKDVHQEVGPKKGEDYIFLLDLDPELGRYEVVKLIDTKKTSIEQVKIAIAKAH